MPTYRGKPRKIITKNEPREIIQFRARPPGGT